MTKDGQVFHGVVSRSTDRIGRQVYLVIWKDGKGLQSFWLATSDAPTYIEADAS